MQGYRTYISIVLSLLGAFGVFEKTGVTQADVASVLDTALALGSGMAALYYNYQNHKKMA